MVEPELAVVVIVQPEPKVHELGRRADVELQSLEDGFNRITLEPQSPLHAPGVDGAGCHPLVYGDVAHHLAPKHRDEVWHPCPVDQVAGQQVLREQDRQVLAATRLQATDHRGNVPRPPPAVK